MKIIKEYNLTDDSYIYTLEAQAEGMHNVLLSLGGRYNTPQGNIDMSFRALRKYDTSDILTDEAIAQITNPEYFFGEEKVTFTPKEIVKIKYVVSEVCCKLEENFYNLLRVCNVDLDIGE